MAHALQNRAPSGFAWPHCVQVITNRVYDLARPMGSQPAIWQAAAMPEVELTRVPDDRRQTEAPSPAPVARLGEESGLAQPTARNAAITAAVAERLEAIEARLEALERRINGL